MTGKTERVVLVKGGTNKWYEQAIFIVNPNSREDMPIDFVAEAERIISDFNLAKLAKGEQRTAIVPAVAKPQAEPPSIFWGGLLAVASLVITAILIFGLLS